MLSEPETSRVKVMSYQDYRSMGDAAILEILRSKHIVTINSPVESAEFNEDSLSFLGVSLDRACIIQGESPYCPQELKQNL